MQNIFYKSRQEILKLFFKEKEEKELYGKKIAHVLGMNKSTVKNELEKLEDLGVLKLRTDGRRKMFSINWEDKKVKSLKELLK